MFWKEVKANKGYPTLGYRHAHGLCMGLTACVDASVQRLDEWLIFGGPPDVINDIRAYRVPSQEGLIVG